MSTTDAKMLEELERMLKHATVGELFVRFGEVRIKTERSRGRVGATLFDSVNANGADAQLVVMFRNNAKRLIALVRKGLAAEGGGDGR